MDGPPEYEVESVTRARVHDKKGKKITWKYYVKWKGYDWDESTWEPTDSFQGGSEHILESFWERMDTGGRDISDAAAFKKGEELLISGPPGGKPRKRKAKPADTQVPTSSVDISSSNGVTISAPLLSPRKRRRMQVIVDDGLEYSKGRGVSAGVPRKGKSSAKPPKRRRASSPGPRKVPKRLPSAGDSQLDADGETDPDVVEVEDELMQESVEDAEEDTTRERNLATAGEIPNKSQEIMFDDLEHFYSGNPIDIDQNADEQTAVQKTEVQPQPQSPPPSVSISHGDAAARSDAPASPTISSYDPLFDSPSRPSDKAQEVPIAPVPHHRVRAAKPLVKLIDTTTPESMSGESRITAKARLMSLHKTDTSSITGPSNDAAKRRGKPGPGRSSSGLDTKNRSSLLTAAKGSLKSVKGKFANTLERDEIEEAPGTGGASEDKLVITSWSDEDAAVDHDHQAAPNLRSGPPSGDELLRLAGLNADPEPLPDYEDEPRAQPQEGEEMQTVDTVPAPVEGQSPVVAAKECGADNHVTDTSPSIPEAASEAVQRPPTPVICNPSVSADIDPPVDEAVRKNIELAKERLFPSTQTPFGAFSAAQSSFRSTIFGPLYQGSAANYQPVTKNEFSTTFKVILGDGVELPLALKDCGEIKARISDILIGGSSAGKVALFYSAEDALAMVSTFKSDGTARVALDRPADTMQQDRFLAFLGRFESSHTLIAPVGTEVCVLYSSENTDIAERLGAPEHLRGLSSTLLISHASIENQPAYVGAIMKSRPL